MTDNTWGDSKIRRDETERQGEVRATDGEEGVKAAVEQRNS